MEPPLFFFYLPIPSVCAAPTLSKSALAAWSESSVSLTPRHTPQQSLCGACPSLSSWHSPDKHTVLTTSYVVWPCRDPILSSLQISSEISALPNQPSSLSRDICPSHRTFAQPAPISCIFLACQVIYCLAFSSQLVDHFFLVFQEASLNNLPLRPGPSAPFGFCYDLGYLPLLL